ncbi:MAG TPA: restriction endonuclease subunit R [Anaerolineae bacterium]|nr:restriction endonuclease subunit R [Saprospirales bacterium]HBI01381.1 restriction endonuclease subunit R [Flavobacterium sp.]HCR71688.1 restriction endonuclease subunit R [Anaerolineae bacterium]HRE74323.1 HsdR family type I site-specific deoxyribonuclease [Flavobacteriales bacterium]HRQ30286.1 HsdR family type I site-specific deoxyribonuclease [Saprospiraceae bacterium]
METPSFKEDHISQIPALLLLQKLGYTYLSQTQALQHRGNKTTHVLLEDILRKQLKEINSIRLSSSKTSVFSDANIENGIQALKDVPMQEGYITACEYVYNLLTLGKALEQSIDGDKKSFTLQYIDWKNPENNVYHVTEEYNVMRSNTKEHYIPDIVLFVNGIPFCIIECKRPDMKESLSQAISQQLRSQQEDGIRNLYVYTQSLLSVATDQASYATNGTVEKFWAKWEEKFSSDEEESAYNDNLYEIKNKPLPKTESEKLFGERFRYVKKYFDALEQQNVMVTKQDEYLYNLCRPERLLDLVFNFILFDNGEKKIARYQQYFAIKKAMQRLRHIDGGKRNGGVIWHTQGSGKSLTMVMLAQAIAMEKEILNPKIILVTDRTDLDDQITNTFKKCGKYAENATTGQRLVELLESKSDAVITTIINKFESAVRKISKPLTSPDIFVLVDEGHRSQHGIFNIDMQKTLPNACFIAMTGTPLFKKEKSTAVKFGGIIDAYTVDQAVKDKAVVPLLYEGRHAFQKVNENPIDTYFNMISEPLNEYQKVDLKKKFSRADQLNIADQKIYAICWDISRHYRDNWQGKTPFKGQLVCQSKEAAIRYKKYMDEIGLVSTEVLISPPDEREGEESAYVKSGDAVKQLWDKMMNEHGNAKKYEKNIISRFKNQKDPEIIIVVDKLLTGFDEPKNVVLYLTRKLIGHKLLQAIARVNRVYTDKDFGYIIDYAGVLGELDTALTMYSSFEDFDEEDLQGTLINISEEIKKLPQKHSELWDIFKTIANKRDAEAYAQLLRDEAVRVVFYDKLAIFARALKLALSSVDFHKEVEEKTIDRYKEDLAMFLKLRNNVVQRYSDAIDYRQYEGQIQKLIDTHIQTDEVKTITELVNIFDKEKFQQEVEKTIGEAAKADKIASRTAKHITEKMDEDPAFYKKFSEMLKDAIKAYEDQRITESQYLSRVNEIMNAVLSRTDSDIPAALNGHDVAKAFYGLSMEALNEKLTDKKVKKEIAVQTALNIDEIIQASVLDGGKPVIDWQQKSNITGKLQIEIGDYLIDEVRDKYQIELSFGEMDEMAEKCIEVAKIRYK